MQPRRKSDQAIPEERGFGKYNIRLYFNLEVPSGTFRYSYMFRYARIYGCSSPTVLNLVVAKSAVPHLVPY